MWKSYTVTFDNVAVTALQDLIAIVAHSARVARITGFGVSQSTELGDVAEEMLRIRIRSGQTTVGSGGGAFTPVANDPTDQAAGFTARINDTTQASLGTIVNHKYWNWNLRSPLDIILPEEQQIWLPAGRRATLELVANPADSVTMSGYMDVCEAG